MFPFSPSQRECESGTEFGDAAVAGPARRRGESSSGAKHPLELKVESDVEVVPVTPPGTAGGALGTQLPAVTTSPTTSETASLPGDDTDILCLKWNGFQDHLLENLISLFRSDELTDVTLVADTGELVKAHKIVLALSSPYFRKLFLVKLTNGIFVFRSDLQDFSRLIPKGEAEDMSLYVSCASF